MSIAAIGDQLMKKTSSPPTKPFAGNLFHLASDAMTVHDQRCHFTAKAWPNGIVGPGQAIRLVMVGESVAGSWKGLRQGLSSFLCREGRHDRLR